MSLPEPSHDVSLHKELLLRIGRGDSVAFDRAYELFAEPLYGLAYRILNSVEETEEVLQDVFVVIWNRAADYDPNLSRPFSWMIVITRRMCWNKLRSKGRHVRKISALEGAVYAAVNPGAENLPNEQAETDEGKEHIRGEIDRFPEKQRKCLELAIYDGFTHEEIAGMMDMPLGTVKTWIRRGVIKLKNQLEEEL